MDWLVTYFTKGDFKNNKFRRFMGKTEDWVDGYIERMKETGGNNLVVVKERMDNACDNKH